MSNKAAWITEAKANPLQINEAPLPKAGPGEVVVKNHAIAINPVEWQVQDNGIIIQKYPNILGCDVAGEVYEVGEGVTHVKKGDRVTGHATGLLTQDPAQGAFQLYTKCTGLLVQKIPSSLSFASGSVLPLSISTAAQALFKKDTLGLPFPTPTSNPQSTGKSVLVWGGSSSVGASAIQLAAGAGVKVVTIASKHNLEKVKELGADAVFDYKSPSVIDDIVSALSGTDFAGVCDCIGSADAAAAWTPIYQKLGGRYGTVNPFPQGLPKGIQGTNAFAAVIATADRDIAEAVWGKWISWALENGKMKAKPDPIVVGKGLESLQKGMDEQRKGVSFAKVVVEV